MKKIMNFKKYFIKISQKTESKTAWERTWYTGVTPSGLIFENYYTSRRNLPDEELGEIWSYVGYKPTGIPISGEERKMLSLATRRQPVRDNLTHVWEEIEDQKEFFRHKKELTGKLTSGELKIISGKLCQKIESIVAYAKCARYEYKNPGFFVSGSYSTQTMMRLSQVFNFYYRG